MPSMDEEDDIRRFVTRGTGSQLADNKSLKDMLDDIEGSGFATGTDSLKVLSDVLDAIEGSGFSTTTDSLKVLSDVLDLIRTELTFQHQTDAALSQASPTASTYYTILDTTLNARIYSIIVAVATTGENLQVKVTIDGKTMTCAAFAATAGTWYYIFIRAADTVADALTSSSSAFLVAHLAPLEARSIKVEVQKTSSNGTGTLSGRVTYAKR